MRHRRRYSTQTLDKKKRSTPAAVPVKSRPIKKDRKYFRYIFIFILAAAVIYALYDQGGPLLKEIKSKLDFSGPVQNTSDDKPEFPAEQKQETELTPIQKKIQVEVLNGCGEQGIAKILTDRLREKGYDVVNSGNYIEKGRTNFNVQKSKIIDQINTNESSAQANEFAELAGIDANLVESFENPSPISDMTIIIGKDFMNLAIFKE